MKKDNSIMDRLYDEMTASGNGPCDYDDDGMTPLHHVVVVGAGDMLRVMLEHGVDVNFPARCKDAMGWTPLHFAAFKGNAPVIELLVEFGAQVNLTDAQLNTPLHVAAARGHAQEVCALLAHGATPTLCNDSGKTALDCALERGHSSLIPLLSGSGKAEDTRMVRLGYSLCAMMDTAKQNGLYKDEENLPTLPSLLPLFEDASAQFYCIIDAIPPGSFDAIMQRACRYLWGKAVEAVFLWAKSADGNIEFHFDSDELDEAEIKTGLPAALDDIVHSSLDDFLPYFKAHQQALLQNESKMTGEQFAKEVAITLEYVPKIGIAYAISKGYHETAW